jgi:hypothetical protein
VIPAPVLPGKEAQSDNPVFNFSPALVSPAQIPRMIEDAKQVQRLSDERVRQLDEI